jgi:urate oxidase
VVTASVSTTTATLGGGLRGLKLLKARGSEFRGFPRDAYTTGNDIAERVLVTDLAAHWTYNTAVVDPEANYPDLHDSVRATLAATFARVHSKSIQYSMLTMATAVLDAAPTIATLTLILPNIHHTPVDLSPFGLTNEQEILIPTQRTHSLIQATFSRETN